MVSNYWTLLFYELRINLLNTEEVETIALNKVSLNILKRMNISHLI